MNKKLFGITIGLIVLIAGSFAYLAFTKKDTTPKAFEAPAAQQETSTPVSSRTSTETPSSVPGSYQTYNQEVLAATRGVKILFFHAAWCPQCRELETSIKKGPIPENVAIFKVDYDSNQTLRQKYAVTLQTTLVKVDNTGNLLKKFVAYNEPSLNALVKNLLP